MKTILDWAPDVDATQVRVGVRAGTVMLKGTVRLYWEKLRAHPTNS